VKPAVGVAFGDLVIGPDVGAGGVDPHAQQPTGRDPRLCCAHVVTGGAAVAVLEHLDPNHQRPPLLRRQDGQVTVDEPVRAVGPARPKLGDRLGGDVQTGHVDPGVEQRQQVPAVAASDVEAVPGADRLGCGDDVAEETPPALRWRTDRRGTRRPTPVPSARSPPSVASCWMAGCSSLRATPAAALLRHVR
jgi:hypothetical protein